MMDAEGAKLLEWVNGKESIGLDGWKLAKRPWWCMKSMRACMSVQVHVCDSHYLVPGVESHASDRCNTV